MKQVLIAVALAVWAGVAYAGPAAEQLGFGNIEMQQAIFPTPAKVRDLRDIVVDNSIGSMDESELAAVPADCSRIVSLNYHAKTKDIATRDLQAAMDKWSTEFGVKPTNYGFLKTFCETGICYVSFYIDFEGIELQAVPDTSKSREILEKYGMKSSTYKGTTVFQPNNSLFKFHKLPNPPLDNNALYTHPSLKDIISDEGGIVIDNAYYFGDFELKTIQQQDTALSFMGTLKELASKGYKAVRIIKPGDAPNWAIMYIQK